MTVLKRFGLEPLDGVRVTLVSRVTETPYSGMLPGLIAGHYTKDESHIDLQPLARFARARAVFDEAIGLDLANRLVHVREQPPIAYDVLSTHASREERMRLLDDERWPLLGMGIACGAMGAAPSLLWAVSALALVLAPLLILVSIWLYTLVFAFSSLWFAHYLLAALHELRLAEAGAAAVAPASAEPLRLSPAGPPGGVAA